MSARQAAVIVDYQNVHLRGHERFCGERPLHECLISPGAFARRLLDVRAAAGRGRAELVEVQVFRGLPEPEYDLVGYQRNLAQQREWETDPLVTVTHRPLRYRVVQQRYSTGPGPALQSDVEAREKGIDVLCALAVISAADSDAIDLVIIASHDSDLDPAVAAVQRAHRAEIEAFQWVGGRAPGHGRLHGDGRLWCTRLGERDFAACGDNRDYSAPQQIRRAG